MAATKGMIFLETGHPIVREFFEERRKQEKPEPVDMKIADFDGVQYNILVDAAAKNVVKFSMRMKAFSTMKTMGAQAELEKVFGKFVASSPISDYDVTLEVPSNAITPDLAVKLSEIKRYVMGAPFEKCFKALASGGASGVTPMMISYRANEQICLLPSSDRVLVIFSVDFSDEADRAIARTFLQEFAEAQRHVPNAPAVTFSTSPPGDVVKVRGFKESRNCVGYVMFQVFKSHVDGTKLHKVSTLFSGFRSYLHYHIKASKAHLHSRMRRRVDLLLKVLNRANPEIMEAELQSKSRPFARKV